MVIRRTLLLVALALVLAASGCCHRKGCCRDCCVPCCTPCCDSCCCYPPGP